MSEFIFRVKMFFNRMYLRFELLVYKYIFNRRNFKLLKREIEKDISKICCLWRRSDLIWKHFCNQFELEWKTNILRRYADVPSILEVLILKKGGDCDCFAYIAPQVLGYSVTNEEYIFFQPKLLFMYSTEMYRGHCVAIWNGIGKRYFVISNNTSFVVDNVDDKGLVEYLAYKYNLGKVNSYFTTPKLNFIKKIT